MKMDMNYSVLCSKRIGKPKPSVPTGARPLFELFGLL